MCRIDGLAVDECVVTSQRRGRPAGRCGVAESTDYAESTVLAVNGVAETTGLAVDERVVGRCQPTFGCSGDAESTVLAVDGCGVAVVQSRRCGR